MFDWCLVQEEKRRQDVIVCWTHSSWQLWVYCTQARIHIRSCAFGGKAEADKADMAG